MAQKKEIFINDDLAEITQVEFDEIEDLIHFYNMKFDLDSLIINVKVLRTKKGRINHQKLDSIRTELSVSSGKTIPNNNLIIINYHHGLDRCNSTGVKSFIKEKYSRYLNRLKKIKNVSQFFMYKTPEGTKDYGSRLNWIEDKSGLIRKTFLPIPYPCGSYVIIDKDGNYLVQKGEYDIEEIIELIESDTSKWGIAN